MFNCKGGVGLASIRWGLVIGRVSAAWRPLPALSAVCWVSQQSPRAARTQLRHPLQANGTVSRLGLPEIKNPGVPTESGHSARRPGCQSECAKVPVYFRLITALCCQGPDLSPSESPPHTSRAAGQDGSIPGSGQLVLAPPAPGTCGLALQASLSSGKSGQGYSNEEEERTHKAVVPAWLACVGVGRVASVLSVTCFVAVMRTSWQLE